MATSEGERLDRRFTELLRDARQSDADGMRLARALAALVSEAQMPSEAFGSLRRMKEGPDRMIGWNTCLSAMSERIAAIRSRSARPEKEEGGTKTNGT